MNHCPTDDVGQADEWECCSEQEVGLPQRNWGPVYVPIPDVFEVERLKEETVPGLGLMLGSSISFWFAQNDRLRAVTGGSIRNDGGEG